MADSVTKTAIFARVCGAALALAALAAFAWTLALLSVEYRYRRLPPLTDEQTDPAFLASLAGELERLLRLDPQNGEIRNAYASVLGRQRKNTEAAAQLEWALRLQNSQNSLFFLADMFDRTGRRDQAVATMADCIVINPFNPQFNNAWNRLLFNRLGAAQGSWQRGQLRDPKVVDDARRLYAEAARNWAVRAPNDANSYLFMANYHVSQLKTTRPQVYLVQAYRLLLLGISGAPWMDLTRSLFIPAQGARQTINDILRNRYAKPYKGLP